jgi:hypothetical protein
MIVASRRRRSASEPATSSRRVLTRVPEINREAHEVDDRKVAHEGQQRAYCSLDDARRQSVDEQNTVRHSIDRLDDARCVSTTHGSVSRFGVTSIVASGELTQFDMNTTRATA